MKKLLLLFVLFSCTSKKNIQLGDMDNAESNKSNIEIVNEKIKKYIDQNANDPSSYQPINTIFYDSLTYLKDFASQIKGAVQTLDFDKEERRLYGASSPASYASDVKSDQKNLDSLKKLKDSLLKSNNPYIIEYYYFLHSCRLKNGFGGLVKSTYRVITDPSLNIIKIIEVK